MAPPLSTSIQTSYGHQFKPQQQNPHQFKMQNSTTETQAKRNHQFDLHGSTTLTDSNKLQPPKLIQKPTTNSATHADSTHLWNPATDSTLILELKPNQHTSETQPIQTTTLNPVKIQPNQKQPSEEKKKIETEKERQRNRKIVREDGEPEKKGRDRIKY